MLEGLGFGLSSLASSGGTTDVDLPLERRVAMKKR